MNFACHSKISIERLADIMMFSQLLPSNRKFAVALCAGLALWSPTAGATPFIGSAADFAVLGLEGGEVIINSATSITGNVGYSANVTSNTNQKVDSFNGAAFVHSTATFSHTPATFAPSDGLFVGGSADAKLDQANADALSAASFLAGLAATHASLGTVGDGDDISLTSVGSLNVVEIASLKHKEDTITLTGGANDVFVFNVAGDWDYDNSQIVLNGISAGNVIFNFTASNAEINIGKAGTVFRGTILAINGEVDYHNPATFDGRIIADNINLHSDFNLSVSETSEQLSEPGLGVLIAVAALQVFRRGFRPRAGIGET